MTPRRSAPLSAPSYWARSMGSARTAGSGLRAVLAALVALSALAALGPAPFTLVDAARLLKQQGAANSGAADPGEELAGTTVPGRFLVKLRPRAGGTGPAAATQAVRSAARASGVQSRAKRIVKRLSSTARVKLVREFRTAWDGFSLHTEDINSTLAALGQEYEVLSFYPVVSATVRQTLLHRRR